MESKTASLDSRNNIVISILAGMGAVVCIFVLSSAVLLMIGILLLWITQCGSDSCSAIIPISVMCGGLIGLGAGIIGSRKVYILIKGEGFTNKSILISFLAGIGIAIFIYLFLTGIWLIFALVPPIYSSIPNRDFVLSWIQVIIGMLSIAVGIIGGRKIYVFIKRRKITNVSENA